MSYFMKQASVVFCAMSLTVLSSVPVVAEDIEIYLTENTGTAAVQPNILFVLDTSGSMNDLVDSAPKYDPRVDFKALLAKDGDACDKFVATKMYFLPKNTDFSDVNCTTTTYSALSFDVDQSRCLAMDEALYGVRDELGNYIYATEDDGVTVRTDPATGLNVIQGGVGFKQDRYTQWTGPSANTWDDPDTSNTQATKIIECQSDDGIHGIDDVSTDTYVSPGTGNQYASSETGKKYFQFSFNRMAYSANYAYFAIYSNTVAPVARKKIDIMRDTIISIMDGGVSKVDIGLMKFNEKYNEDGYNDGGTVMHPVLPVTLRRNDLFATMKNWNANGGTPLSESIYEAMLYFQGKAPLWGGSVSGGDTIEGTTVLTVAGATTADDKKLYKSPVDNTAAECERQFIILLSDGEPSVDDQANALIADLPNFEGVEGGTTCDGDGWDIWNTPNKLVAGNSNGLCLDDLTRYMSTNGVDVALNDNPASVSNAELTGVTVTGVPISTYTIGFDIDSDLLEAAGIQGAGPGGYRTTSNANDLLRTLIELIEEIKGIDTTFASPAVSVNAFNRTTHRNDLYFTLFKPDSKAHWDGNFKRFKLTFDGDGIPTIEDALGANAIDSATGFFTEASQSFWTSGLDAPDGSTTEKGGAASKLTTVRNVYSNLDLAADLWATANLVDSSNTNVTEAVMGLPVGTDMTGLLNWVNGLDTTGSSRRQMGDPLHAQPALIEYKDGSTLDPYIVAYVATNDGYLHAFDTRTAVPEPAKELFSFIPKDLLPGMNSLYLNNTGSKQYGLDGTVASWIKDNNSDGIIDKTALDQVMIFFGMRRGGNDYYAMDVTVPDKPVFKWKIEGGVNTTSGTGLGIGDFTELGQSWSTPQVRKIRVNGADKQVLIFGAGYDTVNDDSTVNTRTDDETVGRGVFIVEAETGKLLWKMGPDAGVNTLQATDMVYSIPSDIAAADASGDGYVDHLYFGDLGGQLWRVDINNNAGETAGTTVPGIITGGRIGDFAGNAIASDRRFFYPPDVAILKDVLDQSYLSVLMTSGNRTHPTDKVVQDRVFMLRDLPILGKPTSYTTATVNDSTEDLFDTTENLIGQGSDPEKTVAISSMQSSKGWFFNFDPAIGEKGLTKPLIFLGEAFFATYVPNDTTATVTTCVPAQGTGYLYHINVENGTPVKDYYDPIVGSTDALTKEDRKKTLSRSGIPADPTLVIPSDGAAVCVGTECDKAEGTGSHKRVFWFEE